MDHHLLGLICHVLMSFGFQYKLKPEFRKIIDNAFNTVLDTVDFRNNDKVKEAVEKVNQWAEAETNGLIKQVLSSGSINALTRLICANVVYFEGAWVQIFSQKRTRNSTFFLADGSSVQVPFMSENRTQITQCFRAFSGFKVLRLPYKRGKDRQSFSMNIFLPDDTDGLSAQVEKVTSGPGFIEHHLPYEEVRLKEFRIPKFKICFEFEASTVLMKLGLVSAFGFTEMVDDDLFVSSTMHKSLIEVNEHGTEAAAFMNTMYGGGTDDGFSEFVADHPFLFIVREDKTGMLLFIGHVLNPLTDMPSSSKRKREGVGNSIDIP